MKKLLTVSLVAVMAVSAAHADIASTKFVTDRTGEVENLDAKFVDAQGQKITNLTAAVNKAIELSGSSVADLDMDAVGNQNDTTYYVHYATQADGKVAATAAQADGTVTKDSTKLVTSGAVYDAVDALDVAETAVEAGKVITAYSETDGKISLKTEAGSSAVAADDSKLITSKGVYATTGTLSELGTAGKDAQGNAPASLAQAIKNVSETAGSSVANLDMENAAGAQNDTTQYVHYVMQTDGKVTAEGAQADIAVTANSSKLVTSGAVYTAVDDVAKDVADKQDKSTANFAFGDVNGNWHTLADTMPEKCKTAGTVCALVSNGGVVSWDVVAEEVTSGEKAPVAATAPAQEQ